jgi:hypothetical protein
MLQIWIYCFSVVAYYIVSYYRFLNTDPGWSKACPRYVHVTRATRSPSWTHTHRCSRNLLLLVDDKKQAESLWWSKNVSASCLGLFFQIYDNSIYILCWRRQNFFRVFFVRPVHGIFADASKLSDCDFVWFEGQTEYSNWRIIFGPVASGHHRLYIEQKIVG